MSEATETATLAGGCFWCVEAALERLDGVQSVTSGYAGGHVDDPTYEQVCTGETGHAEVVQVEFDTDMLDYEELLAAFFTIHNPTTKDREGPDVGSQYRSAIFYHDARQREIAEGLIDELETERIYDRPIVTEVEPLDTFWEAEEYHQDFYTKNPEQGYCSMYIPPKIEKLREKFGDKMRTTT